MQAPQVRETLPIKKGMFMANMPFFAARSPAYAAVKAPAWVSLSATSSLFMSSWLMMPNSSATTAICLPLAMAVLAILAAFS